MRRVPAAGSGSEPRMNGTARRLVSHRGERRHPSRFSATSVCRLLLTTIALSGPYTANALGASPASQYLLDSHRFAVDLYRRLAPTQGNFSFSPWSIRSARGMAYAGSRTHTQAGMMRALHDSTGPSMFHVETSRVAANLRAEGPSAGWELIGANAAWIAQGLALESAYADTLESRYSASPRRIDFSNSEAARATINKWAEEQTHGLIRNLIPTAATNHSTRLVLTNAVYFRGACQDSFNSRATSEAPFHVRGGKVK